MRMQRCVCIRMWLFDRWKQNLFIHISPEEDASERLTLIYSPRGHPERHKLASVGWGVRSGKLVSRCTSVKVWTPHFLQPLLYCRLFASLPPFNISNSPLFALLIHQMCTSFSLSLYLCLVPLFPSLTVTPFFLFLCWWMEWKVLCSCCGISLLIHSEHC